MKKIEIVPQNLFRISLKHKSRDGYDYNFLVNQKRLDYYKDWWKDYELTIEEELAPVSFDSVTLETNGPVKAGRCYTVQTYVLTSPKPLDDFSLDVLRAYGLFMGGQREGALIGKEELEGNYIYKLKSECDSSD